MHNPFKKRICSNCGKLYEDSFHSCVYCQSKNPNAKNKDLRVESGDQIKFFLLGSIGFVLITTIISLIISTFIKNTTSALFTAIVFLLSYLFASVLLFMSLFKYKKELLKSFKINKVLWGVIGLELILLSSSIISSFNEYVQHSLLGLSETIINENENSVRNVALSYPVLSFIFIAILAPFVEEVTYRFGLYSFLKKINKYLAFFVSALVFACIHFGWDILFSGNTNLIIVELISFIDYFVSGLILAFMFEKCGIFGSLTTHSLNNVFAFIMIFIREYSNK